MIINSVIAQGGIQPSGTLPITANGVYDVTNYASADVQVPTTAPAHYVEKTVVNGQLRNSTNIINLNGVTDVGDLVLFYAYNGASFPANTSVDLSGLTTISGTSACYGMFGDCTGIASVDLSGLTTISGYSACYGMFFGCTGIASVVLSSLTTVSGSIACADMFYGCTSLTSLSFPALTSNSFGAYTDQFSDLIYGVTGCTIHFPSNLDPQNGSTVISSLQGYPNFGGTNTVLAFDLPATE